MDEREIALMQVRIRYLEGLVLSLIGHLENRIDDADRIGWDLAEAMTDSAATIGGDMLAWDRYFRAMRTSVDSDEPVSVANLYDRSVREKDVLRKVFGDRLGHI
ncbi:hypothetical protein [Acuticoccus sediminis]|uniref:hypothetical protein n=1 Tax=Acuticoccus sediminis TaxID=2184697 RepID=UPI001CFF15ED|nr:hypothetical protein [Acuticoccus sediminis]